MNQSIHNPDCTKYFIASADGVYSYGVVDPGMYMDSGLSEIEIFTDETIYLNRLYELGIIDRYYILKTGNFYQYGVIDSNIDLDTEGIEIFTDEDLYLDRLDELDIDLQNV